MHTLNDLPKAPLWRKLAALVYDALILAALSMAYGGLTLTLKVRLLGYALEDGEKANLGLGGFIGWVLVMAAFYWFFWQRGGQTIGMRAWRLRLVSREMTKPSLIACLIRSLVAPVSLFALGLGYWWQLLDKQQLTLHDRLSNTQILLLPKAKK
ncbi:RDD family protein [Halioxenophilus aromaticivorans]|uniref:RDD family protein n=1 Tax=Halioxenophilus aromaticivorans TaxID=1306992 RepID=A0AAV3U0P2_9ALTE